MGTPSALIPSPRATITGRAAGASSPTSTAARTAAAAASAASSLAACTTASGRSGPTASPTPRDRGQADGGVDDVVLAPAVAAQRGDDEADARGVHAATKPGRSARRRAAPARSRGGVGRLEQVGRPAERGHHGREALGRAAVVERPLRGGAAARPRARRREQLAGQRERHLEQARARARRR